MWSRTMQWCLTICRIGRLGRPLPASVPAPARSCRRSGLRRETRGTRSAQYEARNIGGKGITVISRRRAHEEVLPFHVALAALEDAETLILVHAAGRNQRLLTDDAVADDLGVLTDFIVNQPAA